MLSSGASGQESDSYFQTLRRVDLTTVAGGTSADPSRRIGSAWASRGGPEVFHALRNTFMEHLEGAGVAESTVKLIVGHARPSLTFGHYSKGTLVDLRTTAIERLSTATRLRGASLNKEHRQVSKTINGNDLRVAVRKQAEQRGIRTRRHTCRWFFANRMSSAGHPNLRKRKDMEKDFFSQTGRVAAAIGTRRTWRSGHGLPDASTGARFGSFGAPAGPGTSSWWLRSC